MDSVGHTNSSLNGKNTIFGYFDLKLWGSRIIRMDSNLVVPYIFHFLVIDFLVVLFGS